jgi:hypothetical protein
MLHDGLIGDAEGGAGLVAPVGGIEAYRGLLESFACAAEGEEALCVQVREDEDEDVEGEVRDAADLVRHYDHDDCYDSLVKVRSGKEDICTVVMFVES